MIKVISAVIRKDGRTIAVTIQPEDDENWMTAISGGSKEDVEWANEFFGGDDKAETVDTTDVSSIKSAIEKRIKLTGARWDGWKHYHDYELPGQPGAN